RKEQIQFPGVGNGDEAAPVGDGNGQPLRLGGAAERVERAQAGVDGGRPFLPALLHPAARHLLVEVVAQNALPSGAPALLPPAPGGRGRGSRRRARGRGRSAARRRVRRPARWGGRSRAREGRVAGDGGTAAKPGQSMSQYEGGPWRSSTTAVGPEWKNPSAAR